MIYSDRDGRGEFLHPGLRGAKRPDFVPARCTMVVFFIFPREKTARIAAPYCARPSLALA